MLLREIKSSLKPEGGRLLLYLSLSIKAYILQIMDVLLPGDRAGRGL